MLFCLSAIPTSRYIFNVFYSFLSLFKLQMHAWAEVCQSSKSVLTGFLSSCMQYWLKNLSSTRPGYIQTLPAYHGTDCISNSAILRNNYISLLNDLCTCVHVKIKWRPTASMQVAHCWVWKVHWTTLGIQHNAYTSAVARSCHLPLCCQLLHFVELEMQRISVN